MTPSLRLAALGSSYAAGPGITPVLDRSAMRSGANYAHVAARILGANLTDLSVSGATTATILTESQQTWDGTLVAPQIEGLPADADVVTLTAGGNDLGYIGAVFSAAAGADPDSTLASVTESTTGSAAAPAVDDAAISATAAGLIDVLTAIDDRAPRARIVLVDYLPLFGPATRAGRDVPFDDDALTTLRALQAAVEEAFGRAADETGVELLTASELGRGHELGSSEAWVSGVLEGMNAVGGSFHPNRAGMEVIGRTLTELLQA